VRLITAIVLTVTVFATFSVPATVSRLGQGAYQGLMSSSTCIISAESSLTVRVVANGKPVEGARILLNGTYFCNGQLYLSNLSGTTDQNGTAEFGVVPGAGYNVTVIPPASLVGASIVVADVLAPPPTIFTTTMISLVVQSNSTRPPAQSYEPFLDVVLACLMLPGIGLLAVRSRKLSLCLLTLSLLPSMAFTAVTLLPLTMSFLRLEIQVLVIYGLFFAQFVVSPAALFVFLDSLGSKVRRPGLLTKIGLASFVASGVILLLAATNLWSDFSIYSYILGIFYLPFITTSICTIISEVQSS